MGMPPAQYIQYLMLLDTHYGTIQVNLVHA